MSALKKTGPLEEETPVKNLSMEIQEEIIWFNRSNRLNQWVIQHPPSITTRGMTYVGKYRKPEPIEIDEWSELDHAYNKQILKWNIDMTQENTMPICIAKATKLFDIKRPSVPQKTILKQKARLAITPIELVPGLTSTGTTDQLPLSVISLACIGTNTILGAIEPDIKPTCYEGQTNPITILGKEILEKPKYHNT